MTDSSSALDFRHVSVRHGAIRALHEIDLSVSVGDRVALIGPSGGGKSTLLNVAAGLVAPTSGSVGVLGNDLSTLKGRELRAHRRRVGVVHQQLALAPGLRVMHAVNGGRLGSWSTAKAIASLVRPVGLDEVQAALDAVGLADRLDARTGDLSGGQQQRVAVARVLVHQPDLVLADEPTSSVDPELADQVMSLIADPARPWTAIFSAHDPDLARRHADRVIGIGDGGVAFDRPSAELLDDEVRSLYGSR